MSRLASQVRQGNAPGDGNPHPLDGRRAPGIDDFRDAVLDGLARAQKRIPSKFLYDARGSELFDRICHLDEYYLTRTETALLTDIIGEAADLCGPGATVVEFGAGSAVKIRLLLDALEAPRAVVPIDISRSHLEAASKDLAADYPGLQVIPVCADFSQPLDLPPSVPEAGRLGFFPGSTIGNFADADAQAFLIHARALLGAGSLFLIGYDLKKDEAILNAAYDDREGVTAAFNLNLLARVNRELGGDFDLSAFAHRAPYNRADGRVEMHLVSLREQKVTVDGTSFDFARGETIHTENSHKYDLAGFRDLGARAGYDTVKTWTDGADYFAISLLKAA